MTLEMSSKEHGCQLAAVAAIHHRTAQGRGCRKALAAVLKAQPKHCGQPTRHGLMTAHITALAPLTTSVQLLPYDGNLLMMALTRARHKTQNPSHRFQLVLIYTVVLRHVMQMWFAPHDRTQVLLVPLADTVLIVVGRYVLAKCAYNRLRQPPCRRPLCLCGQLKVQRKDCRIFGRLSLYLGLSSPRRERGVVWQGEFVGFVL